MSSYIISVVGLGARMEVEHCFSMLTIPIYSLENLFRRKKKMTLIAVTIAVTIIVALMIINPTKRLWRTSALR